MKVLVTGGTGFVGRNVVRELRSNGHDVFLLARNQKAKRLQDFVRAHSATIRAGDVTAAETLAGCCDGMDAIVHLVGIISEVGTQTYERVHTEGTRNLLEAAQRSKVKRFVQMSALGTRANAVARYHRSKWAAEELVRASPLDWTIFRPSIIYGPGDGFVNLFAKIARRSPLIPVIGNGGNRFQPIAVENVARAFVGALDQSESVGQTLNLAGPEIFTFDQLIDAILEVMNKRRLKLHLPLGIARLQAGALEFLYGRLLRSAPPLNRDQVRMLQEDNVGDGRPADEGFGLRHPAFRAGIAAYLQ
jgi:uncharacterized protein YbjT (DUF2867 family)